MSDGAAKIVRRVIQIAATLVAILLSVPLVMGVYELIRHAPDSPGLTVIAVGLGVFIATIAGYAIYLSYALWKYFRKEPLQQWIGLCVFILWSVIASAVREYISPHFQSQQRTHIELALTLGPIAFAYVVYKTVSYYLVRWSKAA